MLGLSAALTKLGSMAPKLATSGFNLIKIPFLPTFSGNELFYIPKQA